MYCPLGLKSRKLEFDMWKPKGQGKSFSRYTESFQELTHLICTMFVANEIEKVDSTSVGLPRQHLWDSQGLPRPKTLDRTIEWSNEVMDQNSAHYPKGNLTTSGRLMIHTETTMVTNSKTLQDGAKWNLLHNGRAPRGATKLQNKIGALARVARILVAQMLLILRREMG
ncbi:hypothetical protein Tco_0714035 [Tanacetum coccineum]